MCHCEAFFAEAIPSYGEEIASLAGERLLAMTPAFLKSHHETFFKG